MPEEKNRTTEEQEKVLEMMENNERLIGKLYSVYAGKIPEIKSFWEDMSGEEEIHAGWILALSKKIKAGQVYVNKDRFRPEAIQNFNDYLNGEIALAEKEESPDIVRALAITVDIENSLLENKFFEVFKTDSAEIMTVLDRLRINTQVHLDNAKRMLENHKRG